MDSIRNYGTRWIGLLALGLALLQPAAAQVADDFKQYTSVNQLGIGLTNFGVLGNGYNRIDSQEQPSGQYKQHSQVLREQVEHFSYAGLWVGGIVNGQPLVSTSIVDGVLESGSEGWEFLPLAPLTIKSSLVTDRYYNPTAVSHQDFTTRYTDIFPPEATIPEHTPLGIEVTQRSFAWDFSFADAFVIFEYTITNVNLADTINNIYAGIWMDASIANMNYTSTYTPGGGFYWYDNLDGFDETVDDGGFQRFLSYQYDADGDDGWAESYIAVKTLGGTVPQPYLKSFFTQWVWTSSNNTDYPRFNLALTDPDRYSQLSTPAAKIQGPDVDPQQYKADGYPADPNSWLFMHSAGPLGSLPANLDSTAWKLPPGDSLTIVFAIIGARWASGSDDSQQRRANMYVNADWAQKTYDGEDVNRNNVLDPGENKNDDPELNRYILPEPPLAPRVYLDIRSQQVDIYWDRLAEDSIDPISAQKDFEGYRIYGARKTTVETQVEEFSLLAEFDLPGNGIAFDNGLELAQITDSDGEPDSLLLDGTYYHYKYANVGIKNGWLNYYAVTAFDRGDPATNLASLESSPQLNKQIIYPGTVADTLDWNPQTGVYPNPYRGSARWDGYGTRDKLIWFQYLPPQAEIRIYTLAGDLVKVIQHQSATLPGETARVSNINYSRNPRFAGGEAPWDLITRHDQEAATGLYLFTIRNIDSGSPNYGKIKEGKFVIIK